jgi:hypothetical protein
LATRRQSVIEEKGEGFENGKTGFWLSGVLSTCSPFYAASEDLRYWLIKALCIHNTQPKLGAISEGKSLLNVGVDG